MESKKKFPYDKVFLGIFGLLLALVLFTPSVTGFVKYNDHEQNEDLKMSIIIENTLKRMDKRGEISLSKGLSEEEIEEKLNGYFKNEVKPRQEGYFFSVDQKTGKTQVKKQAEIGEVLLNDE